MLPAVRVGLTEPVRAIHRQARGVYMGFGVYEACCLRRVIELRLEAIERRLKKLEYRITELPDVEHYYTELSQLEQEQGAMLRIDDMLSLMIAKRVTLQEFNVFECPAK